MEFRYVSHQHVQPWLIHSYKNIKGRGLTSEPDETEDLVNQLTLKDFPGAPTLPEDRAIRPSQPFTSSSLGDSTVVLLTHHSGGVMMTKKRPADQEQELPSAKRSKPDGSDGQVNAEAATSQSNDGRSEPASSVITCPSPAAPATEGVPRTTSSVTSPGGRYLLKTINPDQQVVEEKFVDETELPLAGLKRITKKIHKKELSTNTSTTLPGQTESQTADALYTQLITTTTAASATDVSTHAGQRSSADLDTACHKADPLTVQIKTSTDTVIHTSVLSTTQNMPSIMMSPSSTLVPSMTDVVAEPNTSSSTSASVDSSDVLRDTFAGSASVNTTASPSPTSQVEIPPSQEDVMTGSVTESKHSLQMSSGNSSISDTTTSSPRLGYTIQVKLPPMTNMKDVDIKGILQQVHDLIKSGVLKVSETKTQVLTVDIGDLKILVSVIPRAPKQHQSDSQHSAQPASLGLSCSGSLTEQKSPVMASHCGKNTASRSVPLMASPRTPVRYSGGTPIMASIGTPITASTGLPIRVSAGTSGPPSSGISPIRVSDGTPSIRASRGTLVNASHGTPSIRASPKSPDMPSSGTLIRTSAGTPGTALPITPVRCSAVDGSPKSAVIRTQATLSTLTDVISSPMQPAARHSPSFTSSGYPPTPTSEPASKRKKISAETLPQVDGTNDPKPEQDKGEDSGSELKKDTEEESERRYVFGHGLGAPPTRGTYQSVRLVCRPWKTPEGTVNRPVLQMMLEGLLAYIMTKPGITWQALVEKYGPILQPVPLMELMEMLEVIGCMYKVYLKSSQKPSLFSSRVKMERDDICQSPESTETLLLTPDCVLKMGQFVSKSQLNKR